jgi:diguanylate cyclase
MKERFTSDNTVIYLAVSFAACVILPFIIYRFIMQESLVAIMDIVFLIGILCVAAYIWKTNEHRFASIFGTIFSFSCITAIIHVRGLSEIYWIFPMMIASFYVLKPREAITINLIGVLALSPVLYSHPNFQELSDMVGAIFITNIFGLIFASKNLNQHRQLEEIARKDVMTNTGNRRALTEELERILVLNKRSKMDVVMIMFDIDRFKDVNDTKGHHVGDHVLSDIPNLIRTRIRTSDNFFRYGGDEFVILALDTEIETATQLAESLRELVEKTPLSSNVHLTISLGVAELKNEINFEQWLQRTDTALYQAKQSGRNCVFSA